MHHPLELALSPYKSKQRLLSQNTPR